MTIYVLGVGMKFQETGPNAVRSPAPWSLPLATDLSARDFKLWHDLLLRMPDALQVGVGGGGGVGDLSGLAVPNTAAILEASPDITPGPKRSAQAMARRVFHLDFLDTVLLHGQERVSELIAVGERILKGGLTISNSRETNFQVPLRLNDSSLVALRPDTLEALAHSSRYLLLRTQAWMRRFPVPDYQLQDGPASTSDIERAISKGLNRERARAYEAAIALASLSTLLQEKILLMSPSVPCTPYAEAISIEFEKQYQVLTFGAWQTRKGLEPGGAQHSSASKKQLDELPLGGQAFVHRLARYRLDALRRCGADDFASLMCAGKAVLNGGLRPLDRGEIFTPKPLSSLPLARGVASIDDRILDRITEADHTGWFHTLQFFDALGINELRQPRGAERGDGADVSYPDLPQSNRNRVRLNVFTAIARLAHEDSIRTYLERKLVAV